jgi:ubiquinone biosynthesis protein
MRGLWFVGRMLFITAVAWWAVGRYVLGRMGTLFLRDPEKRRAAVATLRGRVLVSAMATLGATFVKLGQVMSSRPDLFEPEMIAELRKLQDRMPAFGFVHARRAIETTLGGKLEDHFADFSPDAIAAASVAQVHRARLPDGRLLAVKILRPGVREMAERDGAVMIFGARVLALIPAAKRSDPVGHMEHFVKGIVEQTDLSKEASNYARFRENFRGFDGVSFPEVYGDLSGESVLTMEYVDGHKIDELGPGDHSLLAKRLQRCYLKMCFEDGFVHADLHPGNFRVRGSDVIIFDVGLVKALDRDLLDEYIDFNKCLAMGSTADVVHHLQTYHHYMAGTVDWPLLTADLEVFTTSFRGKPMAEIELGKIINDMFAIGRKHGIRPRSEMALLMVAGVTSEGVAKMINPDADSFSDIAAFLLPIIAERGLVTPS